MKTSAAAAQLDRVFAAFPSFESYVADLPNPQATVDSWRGMLAACDDDDVVDVVDGICDGSIEPLEQYDAKDRIAANIRRRAMERKRMRDRAADDARKVRAAPSNRRIAVDCVHRINRARSIGDLVREGRLSVIQRDEQLQTLIDDAPDIDDLSLGRVDCWRCVDRGFVLIAHPDVTMRAKLEGIESLGKTFRVCQSACVCAAGEPHTKARPGWTSMRRYDETKMCRVRHNSDHAAIAEWMEKYEQGLRHSVFDEWNQGA